jgi:hypothetical protein
MKKSVLEIYALLVCFVCVVCFAIYSGSVIYDVIKFINPEFTISTLDYNRHLNNDVFWRNGNHINYITKKEIIRPPEQELTKQRIESYQTTLYAECRNALQDLTKNTIIIVISIIFFFVHWRIARHAREANIIT